MESVDYTSDSEVPTEDWKEFYVLDLKMVVGELPYSRRQTSIVIVFIAVQYSIVMRWHKQ